MPEPTGPPFPSLPTNVVFPATLNGKPVVVKRGPDLERERRVLASCPGMVRIVKASPGELVTERLGRPLAEVEDDEQATRIAAHVMLRIRAAPTPGFPTLHDWSRGFTIEHAETQQLYRDLVATQKAPVLLHGDLHHANILQADDGWLAIDPQGVLGEPAYEVGAFMRNPLQRVLTMPAKQLTRRLDLLAELLHEPRERLQSWSYVQAVLASCWSVQDGDGDAEAWLQAARKLSQA